MSAISDQMMENALEPWFNLHGQRVTITSGADAGKSFTATLVISPPTILNGEIVQDNREEALAVFNNNSYPNVKPGDYMKDESNQVWKFGERENNPVDSTVDFKIIKKTTQDK